MPYDLADYLVPNPSHSPYTLDSGELCYSMRDDKGYTRFLKNQHYETLWFDDTYVYRGLDTSGLPGEVYALFTGERYGSAWAKRFMSVGDVFQRVADVRHYDAHGAFLRTDTGVTTYLRLYADYDTYTLPNTGQTVADAVLLKQSFSAAFADTVENYYFAKGIGLIQFDFYGDPPFHSQFSGYTQIKPVFTALPGFTEPIPPPVKKESAPVPDMPTNKGSAIVAVVRVASGLNIRSDASVSAPIIAKIAVNSTVSIYPSTVKSADGYPWVVARLTDGTFGWAARADKDGTVWLEKTSADPAPTPTPAPPPTPTPAPTPQSDVQGALDELNLAVLAQLEAGTRVQNAIARMKGALLPATEDTFPA